LQAQSQLGGAPDTPLAATRSIKALAPVLVQVQDLVTSSIDLTGNDADDGCIVVVAAVGAAVNIEDRAKSGAATVDVSPQSTAPVVSAGRQSDFPTKQPLRGQKTLASAFAFAEIREVKETTGSGGGSTFLPRPPKPPSGVLRDRHVNIFANASANANQDKANLHGQRLRSIKRKAGPGADAQQDAKKRLSSSGSIKCYFN
jgi:hypothetical protein